PLALTVICRRPSMAGYTTASTVGGIRVASSMNNARPWRIAVTSGPWTNTYRPSGVWVYSPTRSATVVSPSPGTVTRSVNAASPTVVWPVPGGPSGGAGPPAARSLRSAVTSGRPEISRGWYSSPFGRVTGPVTGSSAAPATQGTASGPGAGAGGVAGAGRGRRAGRAAVGGVVGGVPGVAVA